MGSGGAGQVLSCWGLTMGTIRRIARRSVCAALRRFRQSDEVPCSPFVSFPAWTLRMVASSRA
jgi:hypothetical protein